MLRAKPVTSYRNERKASGNGVVRYKDIKLGDITEEEKKLVKKYRKPPTPAVIVSILMKLAVHKRMENDQDRQVILFADFADLLAKDPEYAIIQAVLYLIEYDTDPYFPVFSKLREAIDAQKIDFKEYDNVLLKAEEGNKQINSG